MKTKRDKQTNVRLTPEAKRLLDELVKKLGVTQAAIIEMAIRKFAEQENVK
jgi:predicted DNA-binding protein